MAFFLYCMGYSWP